MGAFSIWHWLVVLVIVLVIFGPSRLPGLGRDIGKSIRQMRDAMSEKNITPEGKDHDPK